MLSEISTSGPALARKFPILVPSRTAAEAQRATKKWTARHIPAAKRFSMVKLSVEEAFENRWNL